MQHIEKRLNKQQQKGSTGILKEMYKLNWKLQKLRSSQKFLSKEEPSPRHFKFCCCDDEEIAGEDIFAPAYSMSPQPKISIKRLKRHSPNACNHTNSDFSLSKQSQRSNVPISKKATQTHISSCPNCPLESFNKPQIQPFPNNITFLYSNAGLQNKSNNYNVKTPMPNELKSQSCSPQTAPKQTNYTAKAKQLDQNIEKQFKNILDLEDNVKDQYSYGEAFPLENYQNPPKVKTAYQTMPNFSFGQNQKEQFMSKYLNIKQETSLEKVVISSKENSRRSELMKEIIEEKLSKSSKSSGRVFVRGTFNKNNLSNMGKRKDLIYKSQSQISLESSQSLVIQSYQSIMRKKESFIRDYQY